MQRIDDYVVLDVENPNARGNSVCAIGLIIVHGGRIVGRKYSLIDPEDRFDRTNSEITGISEGMVKGYPTLEEYWDKIKYYLSTEIIIGHNITYDLSVISKALERYDIEVPSFRYLCTLSLARNMIQTDSYKLSSLLRSIGYSYNEHNALEDALASYHLYDYIVRRYHPRALDVFVYEHDESYLRGEDARLETNINQLHGILNGIIYDEEIVDAEMDLLSKWIDDNRKYRVYQRFDRIISTLEVILEDKVVTNYEKEVLRTLVGSVDYSRMYSESTLGMQILKGIMEGILCDRELRDEEITCLKLWLDEHDYLQGVYPYDKILNAVEKILEDGVITDEERLYMTREFDEILHPVKRCDCIDFMGKTFCLTGDFISGSRSEIEEKIISLGGISKRGVSGKLDYLIVGGLGSEAWKYGNIGGKIAKAQELQEQGKRIQIISESDLDGCV